MARASRLGLAVGLLLGLEAAVATTAVAEVPEVLNFSGRLATEAGDFTGTVYLTVTLYDDATAQEPEHVLWSDTFDVFVDAGRFHVLLGADPSNPIAPALLAASEIYVGVQVGNTPEMTPRLRVASVPFAITAGDAKRLGGKTPDQFASSGHTHSLASLTGQIGENQVPASVVMEAELTAALAPYLKAGQVRAGDLADWGCVEGAVVKWSGEGWVCGADNDTTYFAGPGILLDNGVFYLDQVVVTDLAKAACYDTPEELHFVLDNRYVATPSPCTAGQYLRWAGAGWECATPAGGGVTSITAGTGLSGGTITTSGTIGIAEGGVGTVQIADGAVTGPKIASSAVAIGHIAGTTRFVSVQNSDGTEQFAVTKDAPALKIAGGGGTVIEFNGLNNLVTITSTTQGHTHDASDIVSGPLAVSVGGTGATVVGPQGSVAYSDGSKYAFTASGTAGQVLVSNGSAPPTWGKVDVASQVTGVLSVGNGGTGLSSVGTGALLAGSTGTALQEIAPAVAGNVLLSAGASAPPVWGKVGLATHVSGTLPVTNGGTGATSLGSAGGVAYSDGSKYAFTAAGTAGQVLVSNGSAPPTWGKVNLASHVEGVLPVANGGTGSATQNFVDLTNDQTIGGRKVFAPSTNVSGVVVRQTSAAGATAAVFDVQNSTGSLSYFKVDNSGNVSWQGTASGSISGSAASFTGSLGGDVTGTMNATTVTALRGYGIATTAPSSNQVLRWSGSAWTPAKVALATDVTGTLPVANGGTGLTSVSTGALLAGSTGTALQEIAPAVAGNVLLSAGASAPPVWGKVGLATHVSGTLPVTNGGTGATSLGSAGGVAYSDGSRYVFTDPGGQGTVLRGGATPSFGPLQLGSDVTGVLSVGNGGTGLSSVGTGALLAGSTGTALQVIAPVAVGSVLLSNGVGSAPTWGKVGLATHVSGTLPVTNGGTGATSLGSAGGVAYSDGSRYVFTDPGGQGTVLRGGATPSFGPLQLGSDVAGVLSVGNGGTGLSSVGTGALLAGSTGTALQVIAPVAVGSVLLSNGVGSAPTWGKVGLATHVSGTLPVTNGGTGATSLGSAGGVAYSDGSRYVFTDPGGQGTVLRGGATPSFGPLQLGSDVAGVLSVGNGGTGLSSVGTGALLAGSTGTALQGIAPVAVGSVLLSNGVGSAPTWGKVGLATHVSGTLPIANGGTGATSLGPQGSVAYSDGSKYAFTAAGSAGQVLVSSGSTAPIWASAPWGTGVTNRIAKWTSTNSIGSSQISEDATGLTFNVNSSGTPRRALRLEAVGGSDQVNIVGGVNPTVASGAVGVFIGGGGLVNNENSVTGNYGVVVGGASNRAGDDDTDPSTGIFAFVGGGAYNEASANVATVAGGSSNKASAAGATVAGGSYNGAEGLYATVGGGSSNNASNEFTTVGGGTSNNASGAYATVGGGILNTASGGNATVGGGNNNRAEASYATVGGGFYSTASGAYATVAGGYSNRASANFATVAGGLTNKAWNEYTTVGGGFNSDASGAYATVGGGSSNTASGAYATVGGGTYNWASNEAATVGGGHTNEARAIGATVAGGTNSQASGAYATVSGGSFNNASGTFATVSGGSNSIASFDYATIGGGNANRAEASYATVGGGFYNTVSGNYATVGGGFYNTASGIYATVGGGSSNTASGNYATVGGGLSNRAEGFYATVSGGSSNIAFDFATVGGGENNRASGSYSVVPGGQYNEASGLYSLAAGYYAKADRYGQFALASGRFAMAGDAQASIMVLRTTTSGTAASELFLDGSSRRITLPTRGAMAFRILAMGTLATGASPEFAAYEAKGILHNSGTACSLQPSSLLMVTIIYESSTAINFEVSQTGPGGCELRLTGTGLLGTTMRWVARVETVETIW